MSNAIPTVSVPATVPQRADIAPVVVIDSIMGAGKTTYIIDHMNRAHSKALSELMSDRQAEVVMPRFLYVTPLLDEVERVKLACPLLDFRDPQPIHGRKYYGIDKLVEEGANIATTHALFTLLSAATMKRLKEQGYTLVIDEVLTCVDYFSAVSKADLKLLFGQGLVYVDGGSHLRWNHTAAPDYRGKFEQVMNLCDNGNLIAWSLDSRGYDVERRGSVLLWAFPVEFLACFRATYLLTYLFHGSPMRAYLQAQGVAFDMRTVTDGGRRLSPWSASAEKLAKERIRKHLKVYEGKLNDVGKTAAVGKSNPLSKGWFSRVHKEDVVGRLRAATENYFRLLYRNGADSRYFAWTTFKPFRSRLSGPRYRHRTQWIPLNAKATNDYRHKTVLAYLANRFSIPEIKGYFDSRGVEVYEEVYALSELVQWLWRSAIRDDKEPRDVHVYVPSERMRNLLKLWLSCDDALEFIRKSTGRDLKQPTQQQQVAA